MAYLSKTVIAPFVFAFFIAYAINPLVEFFQKKGAPRDWAIITVYLILLLVVALVFGLIIPRLMHDLTGVIQQLPTLYQSFQITIEKYSKMYWQLPANVKEFLAQVTSRGEMLVRNSLLRIAEGMVGFFSRSFIYLLVPLLSYYISRDYPKLKENTQRWLYANVGSQWTQVFLRIDAILRLYIRGQLLDTLIVGLLISVGLSILGIDIAFLLGMMAGFLNLIPYFGPVLGAIPAIIFALMHSPWSALYVTLLFLVVNQLEVIFLAPKIIGGTLRLSPLLVIYLILIGGQIFGLVGMIFAVPLGSIVLTIVKTIYDICFGQPKPEPKPE